MSPASHRSNCIFISEALRCQGLVERTWIGELRDLASSLDAEWTLERSFKLTNVSLSNIVNFIFLTFKKIF